MGTIRQMPWGVVPTSIGGPTAALSSPTKLSPGAAISFMARFPPPALRDYNPVYAMANMPAGDILEETMQRTKPPFRADQVGSLLRPAVLKDAREKQSRGEITAAELKAVEDQEIKAAIRRQEEVGLSRSEERRVGKEWEVEWR